MTVAKIIDIIRQDGGSWLVIIFIVSSLVEISPIKINPISAITNKIVKNLTKDLVEKIDAINIKLDAHIKESEERDVRQRREFILDFANSCMNDRKHSKEEFDFVISECDKYEMYCKQNSIKNGVAEEAISAIHRIYSNCFKNNTFL